MAKFKSMKQYEGSAADKKFDKKSGLKEGSKKEEAGDRAAAKSKKPNPFAKK